MSELFHGTEPWAIVLPGPDTIRLVGNQQLHHSFRVYVNFMQGAGATTLKDLRAIGESAFDSLMIDQTRGGTCFNCLPLSWQPGFMTAGEYTLLGIQTAWDAENWQTFPLPSHSGKEWTSIEDIVEKIVSAFKDEIFDVPGIDDISEGEEIYSG
ncbi:unnamed protein product, partial [marine sediment metagenome]